MMKWWILFGSVLLYSCGKPEKTTGVTIGTTNGIDVSVVDKNGEPVENASVYVVISSPHLKNLGENDHLILDSAQSNSDGIAHFEDEFSADSSLVFVAQFDSSNISIPFNSEDTATPHMVLQAGVSVHGNISVPSTVHDLSVWSLGSPEQSFPDSQTGDFSMDHALSGNNIFVAKFKDDSATWIVPFATAFSEEGDFVSVDSFKLQAGDFLLENFQFETSLWSQMEQEGNTWNIVQNSKSTVTANLSFQENEFIYKNGLPLADKRFLHLDFSIDSGGYVIVRSGFKPKMTIQSLDSISFKYRSDAKVELELTRVWDYSADNRQISYAFEPSEQWTTIDITAEEFQSKTAKLSISWDEFSTTLAQLQWEIRDQSGTFFELDDVVLHGVRMEGVNYFPN